MRFVTSYSNDLYTAYVNGKQVGTYVRDRKKEDVITFAENLFSELKSQFNSTQVAIDIKVYPTNDPEGVEIIDYYHDPNDPTEDILYICG